MADALRSDQALTGRKIVVFLLPCQKSLHKSAKEVIIPLLR
jgi:hypothetical protein